MNALTTGTPRLRPDDDWTVTEAALWYAANGFPVFPVHCAPNGRCSCRKSDCEHPGKHPRTKHGFKDATTDPEQIKRWWGKWPDANIGIPTGPDSRLLILDIDPRNGGEDSWKSLVLVHGPLETAEQMTGGGGRHIALIDPGVDVPSSLAPGIDIKASGGYFIAAPSMHARGRRYEWDGIEGVRALLHIAPVPTWLLDQFTRARNGRRSNSAADGEKWTPGERNRKLASFAGTMRRRGMSRESIEAALLAENQSRCDPCLPESEVRRIAESVASYKPATDEAKPQGSVDKNGFSTAFRLTKDAVLYNDADPDKEPIRVCGRLEVAALTRDGQGDCWGRLLKWPDAEGRMHVWTMPMSLLAGDGNEYRARLLDGGLIISPGRKVRDLLTTYIQTTYVEVRTLCVSRIGWQGECFVLPVATIGPSGAETVIFQNPFDADHLLNVTGTLDEWKANVGRFCSGNSRPIFSVSAALAGPLLALVGAESGGVHFVGRTSTGKSTMLYVGGSVVGGGALTGFVQSWRTTANGLEATADLHNDLTLFLDELTQLDAREAADVAYLLANGRGKSRMSRNIGLRKRSTWRLLFVSAGEITLSEHAQTAGRRVRAGAEIRLLNIDADAGAEMGVFECLHGAESPAEFALQLKRAALRFYGTPLRAFLDFLTKNRSAVEKALKNFQADFLKTHVSRDASGEVFRAAQRFALIAAAGELATDAAITGWLPGEATDAAVRCLKSWIRYRRTVGAADAQGALNQVRRFLEAHGASRFQVISKSAKSGLGDNEDELQVVRDRVGFRRRNPESDETEYLILQEAFKSEVCAGYDYRHVREALEEKNFLVRERPHWTVKPRGLPEVARGTRVYCIRAAILEDTE
jgi:uncharacterized protein (DUF927 family)